MPKRKRHSLSDLERFILEKQRLEFLAAQLEWEQSKMVLGTLKRRERTMKLIHKRYKTSAPYIA